MSTITRVYDTYSHASRVVADLEAAGIPSSDISILANKHVSKEYAEAEEMSPAGTGGPSRGEKNMRASLSRVKSCGADENAIGFN